MGSCHTQAQPGSKNCAGGPTCVGRVTIAFFGLALNLHRLSIAHRPPPPGYQRMAHNCSRFRSYTHLVNRMLQSYEDTSRNRYESGWTFSIHHADELLSPNVCKNDIPPFRQ